MSSNSKKYDLDIMNQIASNSRKMSLSLSSAKNPGGQLLNGPTLGNGISKLNNAIQKAASKMSNMTSVIERQTDSIFSAEASMAKEVDGIKISKKYNVSDFNPINQNNQNGEKDDQGKEIKKDAEIDEEKLNEYIKATEMRLDNINNKKSSEEQEYDDRSSVDEEQLNNINNQKETEEQEYDDKSTVEEENLENIQKSETEEQSYNDKVSVNEKTLESINNGQKTEQQEYNDNTSLESNNLNSMNSGQMPSIDNNSNDDGISSISVGSSSNDEEKEEQEKEKIVEEKTNMPFEFKRAVFGESKEDNNNSTV